MDCRRLIAVASVISVAREPTPALPSPEVLRERLAARPLPDPGEFLPQAHQRLVRRYRSSAGVALELSRTPSGVRALDPDAIDLVLFTISAGRYPQILARRDAETPGVGLEVEIDATAPLSVVALSSTTRLDVSLWRTWLSDVFRDAMPSTLPLGSAADRVHGVVLHMRQGVGRDLLRISKREATEPDPSVTTLLTEAFDAAMASDMAGATRSYRKAREHALALGDASGEIRAGLGLSQALFHLGHEDDAEQLLAELIETHDLDARRAVQVSRAMAWRCIYRSQPGEAARWVNESERCNLPDDGLGHPLQVAIAFLEGDYVRALALVDDAPGETKIPDYATFLRCQRSVALLKLGRREEARAEASSFHSKDTSVQHLLWRLLARALAGPLTDDSTASDVRDMAGELDRRAESRRAAHLTTPIHALIGAYDEHGLRRRAAQLLRLRFLPSDSALDDRLRALVAAADGSTVLMTDPADPATIRRVHVTRSELVLLAARAREEVLTGDQSPAALPALRALLFPQGRPASAGTLVLASDGILEEAPLLALLGMGTARDLPLPPVRHVTAWSSRRERGTSTAIASLADAWSDLPGSAREVDEAAAEVYLRGSAVTREALANLPEVGLLHLAVHARREGGLPFLLLADGAVSPIDIGAMALQGSPVVVLSGCATGTRVGGRGVERSLADAFLRAGARAVVATRWPVEDREMHDLMRALVARWPFGSAARAVAHIASAARARGAPARVWASLVVYEPFEEPEPER